MKKCILFFISILAVHVSFSQDIVNQKAKIPSSIDEPNYSDYKKNNAMVNFTAIASQTGMVSYERSLSPSSTIGGGIKIHGAGVGTSYYDNKSGFGLEVNYKVKSGDLLKNNDCLPKHSLEGLYLRPNIGFTSVKFNDEGSRSREEYSYIHGGFDFGKQWIFNNNISFDIYTGLNFFGGNYEYQFENEISNKDPEIRDGNMAGQHNSAVRYGVQLGFLFD